MHYEEDSKRSSHFSIGDSAELRCAYTKNLIAENDARFTSRHFHKLFAQGPT